MLGGIKDEHDYRVRIPFELSIQIERNINNWNETCARAIELFGLPGEKYTCRFTKNFIEFWFLDEKDAMIFELSCG
jgi:hypothetical protein